MDGYRLARLHRLLRQRLPEERSVRRTLDRHAVLLYGALPARSRVLRSWIAKPDGNIAGIWHISQELRRLGRFVAPNVG